MSNSTLPHTHILHVLDSLSHSSGVSNVVMGYLRNMNHDAYIIDVAVYKDCDMDLVDEILSFGGKIHYLPDISLTNISQYKAAFTQILLENYYSIIHAHIANSAFLYMMEARKRRIECRIMHAHSSRGSSSLIKSFRNSLLHMGIPLWCNHFFACSEHAAYHLYPKRILNQVFVLQNSIDTNKFKYIPELRGEIRRDLGLDPDTICVGHIGRFDRAKNHHFLLDMFSLFHQQLPNSCLVLVGDGDLENPIRKKASDLGLQKSISFLGKRKDPERLYQAFDLLIMPSIFEGWGLVAAEAQCAGLPCLLSDTMTTVATLTDNVRVLPLGSPSLWVNSAIDILKGFIRTDQSEYIRNKGFDNATRVKQLQDLYKSFLS